MSNRRRIFFSVGEPSGDLHASNLIFDFQNSESGNEYEFFGYGGPKMAQAGCELMEDLTQHAVMFLSGIFSKIAKFRRLLNEAERVFESQKVDLVVLVDYSGFNWHVAKRAKKHGIPVVFYGIPQMWAWAPWRVRKMRRNVDLGICKLPFEKEWLEKRNCSAEYVGHPFFDEMQRQEFDTEFEGQLRNELKDDELVAILPGSRKQELESNIPVFLKTARLIQESRPNTKFAISCLNEEQRGLAQEIIERSDESTFARQSVPLYGGKTPELIRLAKCCLACSGSVSLELMYRTTPTVIHYRLPAHLYAAQKLFLRIKYITLVNLLWTESIQRKGMQVYNPDEPGAEEVPFPEYLTCRDKSAEMKGQILKLLNDESIFNEKTRMLELLKEKYGREGASRRAVDVINERFFHNSVSVAKPKVA